MADSSDDELDEMIQELQQGEAAAGPRRNFLERRLLQLDGSPALFRQRFRIPIALAEELLQRLDGFLRHDTRRNRALEPREQLLTFLHLCGTDQFYHVARDIHGPSTSTICRLMKRVSEAIITLEQEFVRFPPNAVEEANRFRDIAGFPSVVGCVDGTHVKVTPPSAQEEVSTTGKNCKACNHPSFSLSARLMSTAITFTALMSVW